MSRGEYIGYIFENSLSILLYTCLGVLCARNIWVILIKQRKWKQPLLLTFYFFSTMAIVFRWVVNCCSVYITVTMPEGRNYVYVINALQPFAKILLGLVQTWMIMELFIRLRQYGYVSLQSSEDSAND